MNQVLDTVRQLQQHLEEHLEQLQWNKPPSELYEPIGYMLRLGGKRIRPVLTLMACDLFGGNIYHATAPALGIELFHNFTLLHDDIMDNAPLRRGKATVYAKYNTNVAILSGDALFVEAYQLMAQTKPLDLLPKVLAVFNKAALEVCEGQQYDMNYETLQQVTVDEYIHMITLKTSVLLAAAMQIGALIAGANNEHAQVMYEFGKCIGIAFQLQDDVLDVFGDPNKFGKQVGGDIVSNKNTFLKLKAFELATKEQANNLHELFYGQLQRGNAEKVAHVTELYQELGIRDLAIAEMNNYLNQGFRWIDSLQHVDANKKEDLKSLALYLIHRQN